MERNKLLMEEVTGRMACAHKNESSVLRRRKYEIHDCSFSVLFRNLGTDKNVNLLCDCFTFLFQLKSCSQCENRYNPEHNIECVSQFRK